MMTERQRLDRIWALVDEKDGLKVRLSRLKSTYPDRYGNLNEFAEICARIDQIDAELVRIGFYRSARRR